MHTVLGLLMALSFGFLATQGFQRLARSPHEQRRYGLIAPVLFLFMSLVQSPIFLAGALGAFAAALFAQTRTDKQIPVALRVLAFALCAGSALTLGAMSYLSA